MKRNIENDKPVRDARTSDDRNYKQKVQRMEENLEHAHRHADSNPKTVEDLLDENIAAKRRQNELENKVRIIETQLRRNIDNLKKDRIFNSKGTFNAQFEQDLNELMEENIKIEQEERELFDKVKHLQKKRKIDVEHGKVNHKVYEQDHFNHRAHKEENKQGQVIESLKKNVERSNKDIIDLKMRLESGKSVADNSGNIKQLQLEKHNLERQFAEKNMFLEEAKANLRVKGELFKQSKAYENNILSDFQRKLQENQDLAIQNKTLEAAQSKAADLQRRLADVRDERSKFDQKFNELINQPFFKKENDINHQTKLDQFIRDLDLRETEISKAKKSIIDTDREIEKLNKKIQDSQMEKTKLSREIQTIQAHTDTSSHSAEDIMKQMNAEYPEHFRKMMEDLEFQGKDPAWYNSSLNIGSKTTNESDLRRQIDALKKDKENLASELDKAQQMLKILVDRDKSVQQMENLQIVQIRTVIRDHNKRIDDLYTKINVARKSLEEFQTKLPQPDGKYGELTAQQVASFNKRQKIVKDLDTRQRDFDTKGIDVDDLTELENILDLKITQAVIDERHVKNLLSEKRQVRDPNTLKNEFVQIDVGKNNVHTFLSVDFFNHDSKMTEMAEGFNPNYNTIFSFRNKVDNFFMKHLDNEYILCEIYALPPKMQGEVTDTHQIKIGYTKLPTQKLLLDPKSQGQIDVQQIWQETGREPMEVGKIYYTLSMQKSLKKAIEHYQNNKKIQENVRTQKTIETATKKSIVTIKIESGKALRIGSKISSGDTRPFCHYEFYMSEHYGPTGTRDAKDTHSFIWNDSKSFENDDNLSFKKFLKQETLDIRVIDDSVDLNIPGARDLIGIARIRLSELCETGFIDKVVSLTDERGMPTEGTIRVQIQIQAKEELDHIKSTAGGLQTMKDVVQKIIRFQAPGLETFDSMMGMWLMSDPTGSQEFTRDQLKNIFQNLNVPGVSLKDIELFLKTNEHLNKVGGKVKKEDLRKVFESAFLICKDQERKLVDQHDYIDRSVNRQDRTLNMRESNNDFQNSFGRDNAYTQAKTLKGITDSYVQPKQQLSSNFKHAEGGLENYLTSEFFTVINDFKSVCGDLYLATFEQTLKVLRKGSSNYGVSEKQIESFFQDNAQKTSKGSGLAFQEVLGELYSKGYRLALPVAPKRDKNTEQSLTRIKKIILAYLARENMELETMYMIIDNNHDGSLSYNELEKGLSKINDLSSRDVKILFDALDFERTGSITKEMLLVELQTINIVIIFKQLKDAMHTKTEFDRFWNMFDTDKSGSMDINEFAQMIKQCAKQLSDKEISYVFACVDQVGQGVLAKEQLWSIITDSDKAFNVPVFIQAKDLFLPLQTTLQQRMQTAGTMFSSNQYRNEGSNVLKFEMLVKMIKDTLRLTDLSEQVIATIQEFLMAEFETVNLTEPQFSLLFNRSWKVKSVSSDLKTFEDTIQKLISSLKKKGSTIKQDLDKYQNDDERSKKHVSIYALKTYLGINHSLSSYECESLVNTLDNLQTGYVEVEKLAVKVFMNK